MYLGLNSNGLILDIPQIANKVKMNELKVDDIRRHALSKLYYYVRDDYYENRHSKLKKK